MRWFRSFRPRVAWARPRRRQPGRLRRRRRAARAAADLTCSPRCRATSRWPFARPAGIEMLTVNEHRAEQLVSHTAIARRSGALERRPRRETEHAAAACARWQTRLRHLLPDARAELRPAADRHQGARSVLLEWRCWPRTYGAVAGHAGNPRGTRTARRGTLQLIEDIAPYRHLGIEPPPLHLLINRVASGVVERAADPTGAAAGVPGQPGVRVLDTDVPAIRNLSARSNQRLASASRWSTASPRAVPGTRGAGHHARAGRRKAVPA